MIYCYVFIYDNFSLFTEWIQRKSAFYNYYFLFLMAGTLIVFH
jgi:hypothetical protein